MKKIRDLVIDEQFEQFVLIKSADVRIAKNGKKFIAFTFQDTSGTIDGKYWDASEEEINKFTAGTVVFLNGKREVYQGNPQVKILHMRLTRVDEPGEPSLYMERAPLKKKKWKKKSINCCLRSPMRIGIVLFAIYLINIKNNFLSFRQQKETIMHLPVD